MQVCEVFQELGDIRCLKESTFLQIRLQKGVVQAGHSDRMERFHHEKSPENDPERNAFIESVGPYRARRRKENEI